jgi:hypothetical protein
MCHISYEDIPYATGKQTKQTNEWTWEICERTAMHLSTDSADRSCSSADIQIRKGDMYRSAPRLIEGIHTPFNEILRICQKVVP